MLPEQLADQLARYIAAYQRISQAMNGISTCSTVCECCEMHRRIAQKAIDEAKQCLTHTS